MLSEAVVIESVVEGYVRGGRCGGARGRRGVRAPVVAAALAS